MEPAECTTIGPEVGPVTSNTIGTISDGEGFVLGGMADSPRRREKEAWQQKYVQHRGGVKDTGQRN